MSRRLFAVLLTVLALGCDKPNDASTTAPAVTPPVTPAPDALPDAEKVLAAAVEAAGGAKAHDALLTYYSEARMEMPQQGLSADTKLWWDHGAFFMEVDMPGVGKSRVWSDGTTVTSDDPVNGRRTLEGRERNQARWATSISLVHEWREFFTTAETIGRREQDGKQLLDVKLSGGEGDQVVLSFDDESHMLVSQRFEQQSPAGTLPVEISILEYKEVAGLKHAMKTEMKLAILTATTTVTKLEPNVDIDPAKLVVPPVEEKPPAVVPVDAGKPKAKPKGKAKAPAK